MKLRVKYELNGSSKVTEADEICRIREGFWIDESGNFTHGSDAGVFILPHMIKEIRKISEGGFGNFVKEQEGA